MVNRVNILDAPKSGADVPVTTVTNISAPAAEPSRRRPERGIAASLAEALQCDDGPEQWLEALSAALVRLGYDDRVVLCRRAGDRLHVVAHDDVDDLPADGWLGSFLAVAGVLLESAELSHDGLSEPERRFLAWSAADLYLPLMRCGELVGLMSIGRAGGAGLSGLNTSEVLALECLGRILAERMAEDHRPAAPPVDEILDVPLPAPVG